MDELGFPELSTEQIELLCQTAEDAARKSILSKVSNKDIDRLDIAVEVEKEALKRLEANPEDVQSYYNPYRILIETYENLKDYNKLLEIWQRLGQMYPNDRNVKSNIAKYANLARKDRVQVDSVPKPDTSRK